MIAPQLTYHAPPIYDSPEATARLFSALFSLRETTDRFALLERISLNFAKIPYENVTKIIKRERCLDETQRLRGPYELLTGYRDFGTGGTCFSLVHCLRTILLGFGYQCFIAMADMRHGDNIHCAVMASLDAGRVLFDPGYLIPYPVIEPPPGEATAGRNFMNQVVYQRSVCGGFIELHTVNGHRITWRYRLKSRPVAEDDFIRFWQQSFAMTMMEALIITKADEHGQLYLHNDHLRRIRPLEKSQQRLRGDLATQASELFGVTAELIGQAREIVAARRCSTLAIG